MLVSGAAFPGSLWLYAHNDSFYSTAYSQRNFDAFSAAGGVGDFHVFSRAPGFDGLFLNDPPLWDSVIATFLEEL